MSLTASIASLLRADHGDPFALLGLHEEAGHFVVRIFQPGARAIVVKEIGGMREWPAERVDNADAR